MTSTEAQDLQGQILTLRLFVTGMLFRRETPLTIRDYVFREITNLEGADANGGYARHPTLYESARSTLDLISGESPTD